MPFDDEDSLRFYLEKNLPLVLSPGPKSPDDVQISKSITADYLGKVPILGVCLGHQILGSVLGGQVVKAQKPFHGSTRVLCAKASSLIFKEDSIRVATYNSLVLEDREARLEKYVSIRNQWGEIEGLEVLDQEWPAFSVQFHPESFMSRGMKPLLEAWNQQLVKFYKG